MAKIQALTATQLRELRSETERELAWLLRSLTKQQTNRAGLSNGAGSDAQPSDHSETERLLRDRAQSRLAAIVAALQRLDSGDYGACVSCQARIPYGRLIVMPEATHCIACGGRGGTMRTHDAALGGLQPGGVT